MKKESSILRAFFSVSFLVIIGKLLGFGREAIIAAFYGATAETDAFFFAQGMPSMLFPAVGNSLALAFTSLYVKKCTEKGELEGDHFASRTLLAVTLLGILLSVVGIMVSPVFVPIMAPGFSEQQLMLAVKLTRLSMGAFTLTLLQYILGAILNSKQFFLAAQIAGLLYNASIIAITVALGADQSMNTLMVTVILGMALQVGALGIFAKKCFQGTVHHISPIHPEIKQLVWLSLPILLGNSVVQINNIVDKVLGSTLNGGSLSALNYANTLNIMVIDVFVISLSTVLFPSLTVDAASGDMEHYSDTLAQSLGGICMLLVPISCITILDSREIVQTVYGRGNFDQDAVALTALVLMCYAPRFVFAGVREVLTRAFFALQDTRTPMIIGAIGVGCNVLFSILFVRFLGIAGIALGTVVSVLVIAILLLKRARIGLPMLSLNLFFVSLGKQAVAGVIMMLMLVLFRSVVVVPWPLMRFGLDTIAGFCLYASILLIMKEPQLVMITKQLIQSLRKSGK